MVTHVFIRVHHYVAIVEMGIVNNNNAASLAMYVLQKAYYLLICEHIAICSICDTIVHVGIVKTSNKCAPVHSYVHWHTHISIHTCQTTIQLYQIYEQIYAFIV